MCFDSSLASYPVRVAPLDKIVDLLAVPHPSGLQGTYRERMRRGERFPPISVVRAGPWYLVADGNRRLCACRDLTTAAEIPVEVWTWRRWARDQLRQLRDNSRKNLRILTLLPRQPASAMRLLATTCSHWWRVTKSLALLAVGTLRPDRR